MKVRFTESVGVFFWLTIMGMPLCAKDDMDVVRGKKPFRINKATSAVSVDGAVEEAAWQEALKLELNYEVRPGENITPPVKTEVFMAYNDSALLLAFKCYDPHPEKIRARFSDRDDAWNDDWVAIVLDTFNDERRAYELICNPLGVQIDAVNDDVGGNYDESWNAIWESAGRITKEGYEVEMAIPFNQLRFQAADGPQIWGIDAVRSYPRTDRHHIGLFPRDRGNNSYLSQAEKVVGFQGVSPGRNLEIVPTVTGFQTESRPDFPEGDLEKADSAEELGISARWGITPNLTLNGTLNPDFSQVEADAIQLDINETFALFFNETRPFFLEGADTFNTRINLVHTRTIADPSAALKLTGKQGRHTYGAFSARDDITNILIPGSQGSEAERFQNETTNTVGRYRFDFGQNSTVGALVTNREGGDYHNRVLSLDTRYRISSADSITLNVAGSQTQYSPEIDESLETGTDKISDHAISFLYRHSKRKGGTYVQYYDFGKDFRADMGFVPRTDYRQLVGGAWHLWYGEEGDPYNQMELGGDWDQTEDQSGNLIEREYEGWFTFSGAKEFFAWVGLGVRDRVFNGVSFDQFFQGWYVEMRPLGDLYLSLDGSRSDWIDFDHTREADRLWVQPRIRYNLGRHLFLQYVHTYSILDVDDPDLNVKGERLFTANVPEMRIVYQHNTRTLFRATVQYTDIKRNLDLYEDEDVEPKSEDLFAQLLFSYKLNPQTVAFVGYTDNYEGDQNFGLTERDRTLFVKFGYAWVR